MKNHQVTLPYRLLPLGDTAWTVEFGNEIHPDIHGRVLGFGKALSALSLRGELTEVVEWVPSFRSVTVHINPDLTDALTMRDKLCKIASSISIASSAGSFWELPVCFAGDYAPDLAAVAKAKSLTESQIIEIFTTTRYRVYMIGFLPGFPYMGGLSELLDMPRLATPRQKVPSRSVAIAGRMCAVYPWESPGGWHVLGRTPIRLFDKDNASRPSLLTPGDEVVWKPISPDEFDVIEEQCDRGLLNVNSLKQRGHA